MKREIICEECAPKLVRVMATAPDDTSEGEGRKYVHGKLTLSVFCDWCDKRLTPGERAMCFSLWSQRAPYSPWEADYVIEAGRGQ